MGDKRYCVQVLGKMGFAFSEKEYKEHSNITLGDIDYKICPGENETLILIPISSFDIYDNSKGYYKLLEAN